jgi:hypothetical protein
MLNTKITQHTLTDINLAKHKLWEIEGDRRGDLINCLSGTLWITQEGDMRDYILEPGQNFWVTKPGVVLVQALESSKFKYSLNEVLNHVETTTQPIHQTVRYRLGQRLR